LAFGYWLLAFSSWPLAVGKIFIDAVLSEDQGMSEESRERSRLFSIMGIFGGGGGLRSFFVIHFCHLFLLRMPQKRKKENVQKMM
jgi:hypothetical protein